MIVTLHGMPDGKDFAYDVGPELPSALWIRVADQVAPVVTPFVGDSPVKNINPVERELEFRYSYSENGQHHYEAVRAKNIYGLIVEQLDAKGEIVLDAMSLGELFGLTPDNWMDPQAFAGALCRAGIFACTVEKGPEYFQMTVRRITPG